VKRSTAEKSRRRKRRIQRRLARRELCHDMARVFRACNIDYDVSDRVDGLACGGTVAARIRCELCESLH